MNKETPSRQELRAILSNPASTQEQKIQAKLILCQRISSVPERVRRFINTLPPEVGEPMRAKHPQPFTLELALQAEQEAQRLRALLTRLPLTP